MNSNYNFDELNDCMNEINDSINDLVGKSISLETDYSKFNEPQSPFVSDDSSPPPVETNQVQQQESMKQQVTVVPNPPPAKTFSPQQYPPQVIAPQYYIPTMTVNEKEDTVESASDVFDTIENGIPVLYMASQTRTGNAKVQSTVNGFLGKNKHKVTQKFKPIAYIFIKWCEKCDDLYRAYVLYYDEEGNHKKPVLIPEKECKKDNICKHLKSENINCFILGVNDKLVSQCIYTLLQRKATEGEAMPQLPGFTSYKGEYIFMSDEYSQKYTLPPVGVSFDIETECKAKDAISIFVELANKHTDTMKFIMLNLIRICGLLVTPMAECGIRFTKIVVVKGIAEDINLYLQIYNRKSVFEEVRSINVSPIAFDSLLGGKDTVLTFKDDSNASKYKSENGIQNIQAMSDTMFSQLEFELESKTIYYPFVSCVVSDKLSHHLSGKYLLTLDMESIFPDKNRMKVMKIMYEIDKLIVREVIGSKQRIFELWTDSFKENIQKFSFKYKETSYAFAALMAAFFMLNRIIRDYAELPVSFADIEKYIYDILDKSEKIDDKNTIVNEFISKVNDMVLFGELVILENPYTSVGIELPEDKPVVYLMDKLILFTDDILDGITETLALADNSCNLRKHLNSSGMLKTNDDLKYKVTLPDIGRDSLTAVRESILTEETRKHIMGGDRNFNICTDDSSIERIMVGTDRNGEPVYWSIGHDELSSRHLLIMGSTGKGKSFAMNLIAKELFKRRHNIVYVNFKQKDVRKELASHGFGNDFVEQNVVDYDLKSNGFAELELDKILVQTGKIVAFTSDKHDDGVEKLLDDIYNYVLNCEGIEIILVVDEVHQLESTKNSPLFKIMSMGRGVGISLISAFQKLKQMKPAQRDLLCQAPVMLMFKMNVNDLETAVRMIVNKDYYRYVNLFKNLNKRECYMIGSLEDNNGDIEDGRFIHITIPQISDNA